MSNPQADNLNADNAWFRFLKTGEAAPRAIDRKVVVRGRVVHVSERQRRAVASEERKDGNVN